MTACLLIWQYAAFEWSFDSFHEKADRIFRVAMFKYEKGEPEQSFAFTYPAVAPNLKKDLPEIEEAIRMRRSGFIMNFEDQYHSELVYFVDEPFLDLFSFPLLQGDPSTALEGAYAIVISEKMAKKYFGDDDPLGKNLQLWSGNEALPFEVKGVLEDFT